MDVLVYLGLFAAPALAFAAAHRGFVWFTTYDGRPRARPEDAAAALDRLRGDLRRLGAQHDALRGQDVPAKVARMRALEAAYDDALRDACRRLGITVDDAPLQGVARAQAEAELVCRGFDW